jgi:hypothetical protein
VLSKYGRIYSEGYMVSDSLLRWGSYYIAQATFELQILLPTASLPSVGIEVYATMPGIAII